MAVAVKEKKEKKPKQKKRSLWLEAWRRLCRRKISVIALVVLVLIILSAVFAEQLTPYDYAKQDPYHAFEMPSWKHPFGTDNFGRDLLARVLKGGQTSLLVSLISTAISTVVGAILGATAAYFKGVYATIVMRLMDILMGIPSLLFAVCIATVLGTGVMSTIIAVAVPAITTFCRMAYATVLKESNNEYIQAATMCGARDFRKVFKHLLPNSLAPLIVSVSLRLGGAIKIISSLSFIGLGVQPPTPEWGSIISAARQYLRDFWPFVTFPGIAISLTMISFNVFGDGLRDALDPRQK